MNGVNAPLAVDVSFTVAVGFVLTLTVNTAIR